MQIESLEEYKHDPLILNLPIPVSQKLKDRYRHVSSLLSRYDKDMKLHDFTRKAIEDMLTVIEQKLLEATNEAS